MDKNKERVLATRLSPMEVFFDTRATYGLEDWKFRVYSYYEMLLCMTGPNGVNASEQEMEAMIGVLGLIQWAEALQPGTKVGYTAGEDGMIHPYAIEPVIKYLL